MGGEARETMSSICLLKFICVHCRHYRFNLAPSSFQSLQHLALGRAAGLNQKKKIKSGMNSLAVTKKERETEDGKRKWHDPSLGSPREPRLTRGKVELMACGTHKPLSSQRGFVIKNSPEARTHFCGERVDDSITAPLFWDRDGNLIYPAFPRTPQGSFFPYS